VAKKFDINQSTVSRIWKRAKSNWKDNGAYRKKGAVVASLCMTKRGSRRP